MPRFQLALIAIILIGIPLSAWGAVYPPNTWLQVGPVGLGMLAAIPALNRWPISNISLACVAAFLLLHLFAARWTYSDVPYNAWLGFDLDAAMGFGRNMFDRLVHFSFGLLAVPPMVEIAGRYVRLSDRMAQIFAMLFVLSFGAVYEIFEWLLAVMMDPVSAELYNGQQGDAFDGQKDMAIAWFGAVTSLCWMGMRETRRAD